MANHYKIAQKIFHILYAAKTNWTLREIADTDEIETKLKYLLHFHCGPNMLDTGHLKLDVVFGPVCNSNATTLPMITDKTTDIYGTTMMLTAMVNALI